MASNRAAVCENRRHAPIWWPRARKIFTEPRRDHDSGAWRATLAEDLRERSIGVLLSGMGSDGTLGLGAIKENGGATFVQVPGSAKFDGMPRRHEPATVTVKAAG